MEQRSITICKPLVVSVVMTLDGVAVVVAVTVARFSLPEFVRSNERCIVSPGTILLAATVRRFVAAPVEPRPIVTVPELTDCDADVDDVNEANVPRPAIAAATPSAANDRS